MSYNLTVKNLYVGTMDKGIVTLDVEQKLNDLGLYTLEYSYNYGVVEKNQIVDIEEEMEKYVDDAKYDGEKAIKVIELLEYFGCDLWSVQKEVAEKCASSEYYRNNTMSMLGLDYMEHDEEEIIAIYNDGENTYNLLYNMWLHDLTSVWKINMENSHMINLFTRLVTYGEKGTYGELVAKEIYELVEKNKAHEIQDHLEAYVDAHKELL